MTIGVISRNRLFQEGVLRSCRDHGMKVHGHEDPTALIDALATGDVILWHFTADDAAPQDDIRALTRRHPGAKIVALVSHALCHSLEIDCGNLLIAALPESSPSDAIFAVLLLAEQGYQISKIPSQPALPNLVSLSPDVAASETRSGAQLYPSSKSTPMTERHEGCEILSEREVAVLALLCAGYSNKLIARSLGICDATVKAHLRSSFRRIGVTNRTQAALWASKSL